MFYGRVLECQAVVYKTAKRAGWLNELNTGPGLALDQLPSDVGLPVFQKFVHDVGAVSTETLSSVATSLSKSKSVAKGILEAFLGARPLDKWASQLACRCRWRSGAIAIFLKNQKFQKSFVFSDFR